MEIESEEWTQLSLLKNFNVSVEFFRLITSSPSSSFSSVAYSGESTSESLLLIAIEPSAADDL